VANRPVKQVSDTTRVLIAMGLLWGAAFVGLLIRIHMNELIRIREALERLSPPEAADQEAQAPAMPVVALRYEDGTYERLG